MAFFLLSLGETKLVLTPPFERGSRVRGTPSYIDSGPFYPRIINLGVNFLELLKRDARISEHRKKKFDWGFILKIKAKIVK